MTEPNTGELLPLRNPQSELWRSKCKTKAVSVYHVNKREKERSFFQNTMCAFMDTFPESLVAFGHVPLPRSAVHLVSFQHETSCGQHLKTLEAEETRDVTAKQNICS